MTERKRYEFQVASDLALWIKEDMSKKGVQCFFGNNKHFIWISWRRLLIDARDHKRFSHMLVMNGFIEAKVKHRDHIVMSVMNAFVADSTSASRADGHARLALVSAGIIKKGIKNAD
jgi:acetone carboxylase gamma subunit